MKLKIALFSLTLFCTSCYSRNNDKLIVMINVESASRIEIAKAIKILDSFKPRVISIDLQFSLNTDYNSDSALVDVLWNTKNLVMASVIENSNGEYLGTDVEYAFTYGSLPEFIPFKSKTGFINILPEKDEFQTLKKFSVYEKVEGKTEYNFAIQTAMVFDDIKTIDFIRVNSKIVDVIYKDNSSKTVKISIYDLINNKIPKEYIANKIILLGYLGPANKDKYFTPMNRQNPPKSPDMYGLEYLVHIILQVIH